MEVKIRLPTGSELRNAEFAAQFYPVYNRSGLILDVRHNRGGNIDSWILEKLLRKVKTKSALGLGLCITALYPVQPQNFSVRVRCSAGSSGRHVVVSRTEICSTLSVDISWF